MEKSPFFIAEDTVLPQPRNHYTLINGAEKPPSRASIGGMDLAGGVQKPVRLHQDTRFAGLRPQRDTDRNKGEAKHRTDDGDTPMGLPAVYRVILTS